MTTKNFFPRGDSRSVWSLGCIALLSFALIGCRRSDQPARSDGAVEIAQYGYEVVKSYPHDTTAFTQGLVFRGGNFLESTGLNGHSTLREVELSSGRIIRQVAVPEQYFAEGLAVIDSRAFQLTWTGGFGFIYDVENLHLAGKFSYSGEGWGLTTDGRSLIMSDGTNRIRFHNPNDFTCTKTIEVTRGGTPVYLLNELEWINGEIFANVWHTDWIVRIDPATGRVRGEIDFSGLLAPAERGPDTDVLNGIAYDAATDRIFVTGKRWPKIFEIRLKARPAK